MRIAAVRVDADIRRIASFQAVAIEGLHDPLLHFELVRAAVARTLSDFLEERCGDLVDRIASLEVRRHLRFGQGCLEASHKIGRADNLFAETADQLQRACVYQRDVGNLVVGRVLHRHAMVRL